jgi:hypothetical protein
MHPRLEEHLGLGSASAVDPAIVDDDLPVERQPGRVIGRRREHVDAVPEDQQCPRPVDAERLGWRVAPSREQRRPAHEQISPGGDRRPRPLRVRVIRRAQPRLDWVQPGCAPEDGEDRQRAQHRRAPCGANGPTERVPKPNHGNNPTIAAPSVDGSTGRRADWLDRGRTDQIKIQHSGHRSPKSMLTA